MTLNLDGDILSPSFKKKGITMPRAKKEIKQETITKLEEVLQNISKEKPPIEDMPLESLADYMRYNAEARKINHKLGVNRYAIKQCPEELHPKQRVVINQTNKSTNPIPVHLSNEMIHFDRSGKNALIPGKTYDLPWCVVEYLSSKGIPIWEKRKLSDGSMDSFKIGEEPRFAVRSIFN